MPDEHEIIRRSERGARIRALLGDEIVQEVFTDMEAQAVKTWRENREVEPDQRETAHRLLIVMDTFRKKLADVAALGKDADRQLAEIRAKKRPNGQTAETAAQA